MLPKRQRLPLRHTSDFFQHSSRWFSPLMTVFWRPSSSGLQSTVIVSKKTAPKATQRNRLKRQLRHLVSRHQEKLPELQLVISPKRNALTTSPEKLTADFQRFIHHVTKSAHR